MKITTWNINSIRIRMDALARLIEVENPDVLCLQETKVRDDLFPTLEITALGYPHQAVFGEKSYNGVAILSKQPLTDIKTFTWGGLEAARHIAATITVNNMPVEIHSLYIPAGGDIPKADQNPKFAYKLRFIDELTDWSAQSVNDGRARILTGDFNIAPYEDDVWSHERLKNIITHTPLERDILLNLNKKGGWVDAVRKVIPLPEKIFTWWSYRTPDFEAADKGRRLDHIWLSAPLERALTDVSILKAARGWEKPSDHVPVSAILDLST